MGEMLASLKFNGTVHDLRLLLKMSVIGAERIDAKSRSTQN